MAKYAPLSLRIRAELFTQLGALEIAGITPDKAFAMITHSPDITDEDYKNLVKRVASVDTLAAFLTEFRSRFGAAGNTATN